MAKRNLTIQLDEETISEIRVVAAERGTSVSQLLAADAMALVESEHRYRDAWEHARRLMADARGHGRGIWQRDAVYDDI